MRPVDKGESPYEQIAKYQDAQPYLEKQLGPYCSFCELPIRHVPEVEHVEAKGGDPTDWNNLLLSCKYCNTRKGTKVKKGDKEQYLWPDEDDTFHPYSYSGGLPQLNNEYLKDIDEAYAIRARNLFNLVKLSNIPSVKDKDRRFWERNEAYNNALSSKDGWSKVKGNSDSDVYLESTIRLAKATGFFSTWMEVFKDDEEIKKALIKAFKGTKESLVL